jgi:hypothetical protein
MDPSSAVGAGTVVIRHLKPFFQTQSAKKFGASGTLNYVFDFIHADKANGV